MTNEFGYAGKILRVDLSSGNMTHVPTADYADRFVGGKGVAAKIYWDEVYPHVKPIDPENRLIFVTGPLTGFSGLASSRWQICGKSPQTTEERFCHANLGGSWGAQLKFAGYDAIVIQGKSDRPVYLLVQDGTTELRDAGNMWGRSYTDVRDLMKNELGDSVRIAIAGIAGENMVSSATVQTDDDASGGGGFGAVMGSKKLKAIAVGGSIRPRASNPAKLRELTEYSREFKKGHKIWNARLVKGEGWVSPLVQIPRNAKPIKRLMCYGCIPTCDCGRGMYEAMNGDKGKWMCAQAEIYATRSRMYYGELNEVAFDASRLLDRYGLDVKAMFPIIEWLDRCYQAGVLTDTNTGIPISKLGSIEFMETLVKKIALRDGFGDVLARGIYQAADSVGSRAKELITDYAYKAGQMAMYGPRIYITTGLICAMEEREVNAQLHEISFPAHSWRDWVNGVEGAYVSSEVIRAIGKRFWGSEIAADFSTYEGKALAAKMIQEREYAKECLILCDFAWPMTHSRYAEDHVGDPTLESKLYSAVTGNETDEEGLYRIGERIFNLQRAILVREGRRGRDSDQLPEFQYTIPVQRDVYNPECLVPGKEGEVISKKGAVVDREKYQSILDEYYQLRGWDVTSGLQTKARLIELDLEDVAMDLEQRELIV